MREKVRRRIQYPRRCPPQQGRAKFFRANSLLLRSKRGVEASETLADKHSDSKGELFCYRYTAGYRALSQCRKYLHLPREAPSACK